MNISNYHPPAGYNPLGLTQAGFRTTKRLASWLNGLGIFYLINGLLGVASISGAVQGLITAGMGYFMRGSSKGLARHVETGRPEAFADYVRNDRNLVLTAAISTLVGFGIMGLILAVYALGAVAFLAR